MSTSMRGTSEQLRRRDGHRQRPVSDRRGGFSRNNLSFLELSLVGKTRREASPHS